MHMQHLEFNPFLYFFFLLIFLRFFFYYEVNFLFSDRFKFIPSVFFYPGIEFPSSTKKQHDYPSFFLLFRYVQYFYCATVTLIHWNIIKKKEKFLLFNERTNEKNKNRNFYSESSESLRY